MSTEDERSPGPGPDGNADVGERSRRTTQPIPARSRKELAARRRILVVDDEPGVRRVVERTLREAGFDVVTAANGSEALERLKDPATPVDVVVLDVGMPAMNGYQFRVRQLADPAMAHVPVVVLSAETMHATIDHLQAAACVPKPFIRGELIEAVLDALESASPTDPSGDVPR